MMWSTFWTLLIAAAAVVGIIIIGKDSEYWDDEDGPKG